MTDTDTAAHHHPVLLKETLAALAVRPDACYTDCTFGRGGHSHALLARLGPRGQVFAFDQDPRAVAAGQALAAADPRLRMIHANFSEIHERLAACGVCGELAGILFDLGVSSPQLEDAARGFSFLRDGPLDMRMDLGRGETAQTWLEHAKEQEIANVLYHYGEERHSRRIARAIVNARHTAPLTGTRRLAELIASATPFKDPHKHPATRSFQAIRIFLNRELEVLAQALPQALEVLAPGGRLAVISFHSLEDRIVKRFIRDQARGGDFPPDLPVTADRFRPRLKAIGKPITPGVAEIRENPRARSAILRVAEKLLP